MIRLPAGCLALSQAFAFGAAVLAADLRAERPNVVFIMADDLGWTDLACFGSGYYETPHIDRLAADGLRLTCHHHCQNCTPTRAALLSGQYPARTGVFTVGSIDRFDWRSRPLKPVENLTHLPLDREILPAALKKAGYATGMFGKWHIGEQGDYAPGRRGFDEAIASQGKHFDFKTQPEVPHSADEYLADFLTDRAVDFIARHAHEPFFLYLPHFGVHAPFQAKPDLVERFAGRPAAGGHHDPTYAAMIASVDESVGRVRRALAEHALADRTVVIFTSDNGGVGGFGREGITNSRGDVTDNAPLRSGKGSLYEGGTRVPFIVHWPGVTPAGAACAEPTIHVDLYPTMLEVCGAAKPAQVLDGESLVPLFRDPLARLDREAIYQHFPSYLGAGQGTWRTTPVSLIQQGRWKLMEFLEDGAVELYDLESDLGERKNLAAEQPERAREMRAKLGTWRQQVGAGMPTANPDRQPPAGRRKNQSARSGT
ncbi:MAG: sulfatase [Planctomycetaceae bacterium]